MALSRYSLQSGLLAVMVSWLVAGNATAQETYRWQIQSNLNAGEPGYVAVQEKFVELAEEMSDGRLQFDLHPVGSLFPIADGLTAVSNGVAEMAVLTGGYFSGQMGPVANLEMGVPGALRTPMERYNFFYQKGFIEVARDAYAEQGVYYLGPQLSPPWDMMSKKPITGMDDFDGLKIRAFGIEAKWYEQMGASTSFLDGGEIYSALSTGVIDAARWASPAGNYNNSFHEVAQYYVQPSPMPVPNNFFAVDQEAWKDLPSDLQAILQQCAVAASFEYLAISDLNDAEAMQKMQEAGVEITRIPQKEWRKMEQRARDLWRDYADAGPHAKEGVEMLNAYLEELGR